MDREASEQDLRAYSSSTGTSNGWISATLAVLRAALSSEVFDAARAPSTPDRIAATTGLPDRISDGDPVNDNHFDCETVYISRRCLGH